MIQPQFVKAVACGLITGFCAAPSLAQAQEPRREITCIAGDLYRFERVGLARANYICANLKYNKEARL